MKAITASASTVARTMVRVANLASSRYTGAISNPTKHSTATAPATLNVDRFSPFGDNAVR